MTKRERLRNFVEIGMDIVGLIFIGAVSLLILAGGVFATKMAVQHFIGVCT